MKFLKRDKRILLIFLILFPTLMILGSLIINVKGGPYVPESHADNGWHWDVDVGDHMYFEGEFTFANASTGEITSQFKVIWIYNITSIDNVTLDWLGTHQFSQVNTTQYYYNVTSKELVAFGPSSEIALFGYNSSDPINHRIRAGQGGMPFLLPINSTSGLQVDVLDDIINETFYYPMSQFGAFNAFDYYEATPMSNNHNIYFSNGSDGFYSSGFYYDNGTLKTGSAYLMVEMGEGPILVTATMTQVFDYDTTDEVQWGVNIGDTFTYNMYDGSDPAGQAMEVLINVTEITEVMLEKYKNGFSEDPIQMGFQVVLADFYLWDGTGYIQVEWDEPIGFANNFYPQYFDSGPVDFNFLYPISADKDDFLFMWNNDTLGVWGAPFDEIYYSENGFFESLAIDSTGTDFVKTIVDKTTGIVQYNMMLAGGNIFFYEIKEQTLVDWSVDVDDIIYFKDNGEEFNDVKATVVGIGAYYTNMTAIFDYYNTMGMSITLPTGQPEHQFFSTVEVFIETWDNDTQSWIFGADTKMAIANIYWPISPMSFQFGAPLLMPEGTTSSELSLIFDFFGDIYDDITYSTGHVMLKNTTLNRELNFHFDETSGKVKMMYGWNNNPGPVSEWRYMSIYPKFYKPLNNGSNSFTATTDFPTGITVNIDVDINGTDAALIYNYFPMNPVNVSLPNGDALAYFDQMYLNYTQLNSNITMTIILPSSIDVSKMIFYFYAYNMSGSYNWDAAPPEFYVNSVTFDDVTNSIIIEMEPFIFFKGIMSAMAYETIADALGGEIPGYDLFLMSLMVIIASGLIIKKVRKKKK
ncbi:MAG: Loki-CTERM sorting domain-containing protein [Promethearchaeota archaeon]